MTTFCKKCVISSNRPVASREYARTPGSEPGKMAFNAEGVCGACLVAERKAKTDWQAKADELAAICARYRRDDGRPDVIICGSGGKDSVMAAHVLRDRYGLNPLTITWAPHEATPVGLRNFRAWLNTGFDNLLVTPNPKVHRLITRLAFQNMLHPFQGFILGQRSLGPKLATQWGINLVIFGEDDAEYEGEAGWQEKHEWVPEMYLGGVHERELVSHHGLSLHDLHIYRPAVYYPQDGRFHPDHQPLLPAVHTIALGNYLRWDPEEAYYFAQQHGFEANAERTEGTFTTFSSIDDKLDPLHYFTMWIKFGVGRASHDASMHIRNGRLTREEGVALVHKYDGEWRESTIEFACEYMGLTQDEFWTTVHRFRKEYPQVQ